ncbi:MAG TPA: 4-carboxymuconolactone decarboxylase [Nocardioidaceae bacterium]|nr:4-carboxymuconolactone decarboxylase [Nocardioidaceae bacterium]
MTPIVTAVRLNAARHRAELPLLVLGPSLGTTATALWSRCADALVDAFDLLAWDLPGHGTNQSMPADRFSISELANGVLKVVDEVLAERGQAGGRFYYAGDSVGGAVGLQLLLDAAPRVQAAALMCTGAKIGTAESWQERITAVRTSGTAGLLSSAAQRWFAMGFLDRHPDTGSALLLALREIQDEAYCRVCEALASFDVRHRLPEIGVPVLALAGDQDVTTPPAALREIASGVRQGSLVTLDDVGHLAPAEAPDRVAALLTAHLLAETPTRSKTTWDEMTVRDIRDAGMEVRRAVLGDEHVARAISGTTDLTREFQAFITMYAWGSIWTRPGLDRRSRSLVTLTALVARGHHEELAMHLRAALRNGVTADEIKELLLQTAIYCGVPDANTAFRIAQDVLYTDSQQRSRNS